MMWWVAGQPRWCWRECRPPIGDRALLALQCNWLRVESSSCFFYASRCQRRFRNVFSVTKNHIISLFKASKSQAWNPRTRCPSSLQTNSTSKRSTSQLWKKSHVHYIGGFSFHWPLRGPRADWIWFDHHDHLMSPFCFCMNPVVRCWNHGWSVSKAASAGTSMSETATQSESKNGVWDGHVPRPNFTNLWFYDLILLLKACGRLQLRWWNNNRDQAGSTKQKLQHYPSFIAVALFLMLGLPGNERTFTCLE